MLKEKKEKERKKERKKYKTKKIVHDQSGVQRVSVKFPGF